jgi:ABC-2 type transport system ATP-binding protein
LELDSLSKRYGDVVALDECSFDVGAGELFGFVGSNGAGKTTAMRIVLGVLEADAGRVRWDGAAITESTRRRRQTVQKLSLGNQQRVQLAAALIHDPEILVLDEPFSGLDPVAVDVMSEVLRERCDAGAPVVFSSHQLDLVERLCDRVGIVRDGAMVAVGAVDELRAGKTERLIIDAPQAPDGWADGLHGIVNSARRNGATMLEIDSTADDQQVLQAALSTGPVHRFARERPSLTELFRHAVSAEQPS